ncbi:MAG: hypothetical protein HY288_04005 [Planctomycetia bacterium]|nr:hypothetical protein [Planctomycetia bacterium]
MKQFVEIPGALLLKLANSQELPDLRAAGVTEQSEIRINQHGDIEMLQAGDWAIIGGLLGDYKNRIKRLTGLDWS